AGGSEGAHRDAGVSTGIVDVAQRKAHVAVGEVVVAQRGSAVGRGFVEVADRRGTLARGPAVDADHGCAVAAGDHAAAQRQRVVAAGHGVFAGRIHDAVAIQVDVGRPIAASIPVQPSARGEAVVAGSHRVEAERTAAHAAGRHDVAEGTAVIAGRGGEVAERGGVEVARRGHVAECARELAAGGVAPAERLAADARGAVADAAGGGADRRRITGRFRARRRIADFARPGSARGEQQGQGDRGAELPCVQGTGHGACSVAWWWSVTTHSRNVTAKCQPLPGRPYGAAFSSASRAATYGWGRSSPEGAW